MSQLVGMVVTGVYIASVLDDLHKAREYETILTKASYDHDIELIELEITEKTRKKKEEDNNTKLVWREAEK